MKITVNEWNEFRNKLDESLTKIALQNAKNHQIVNAFLDYMRDHENEIYQYINTFSQTNED